MATETFTELYPGTGGSKMDEREVPNTAAGGVAHRAVVAVGDAEGAIQTFEAEAGEVKAHVKDASAVTVLESILAALATLDSGVFGAPFTGINGDSVTIEAAMPVAMPTTTLLRAANNTGSSLANVIGIVVVGGDITLPVRALARGVLTLPTSTWDAVTGGSGGLVPGARYYLGDSLGTLTTTPPVTLGTYVTVVGNAISAVTMLVDPQPPILL